MFPATKFITLALFIMLIANASAAEISGDVYDFSLEKITAIISINTTPVQRVVAHGSYHFAVKPGSYAIVAEHVEHEELIASSSDLIRVGDDGNYTLDLILLPNIEGKEPSLDAQPKTTFLSKNATLLIAIGMLTIALIIGFLTYRFHQKKKQAVRSLNKKMQKPELTSTQVIDPLPQRLLEIIHAAEGRITQRDLRKQLPQYSEAKISLALTELEAAGNVKKIKKGRGNVIVVQ
ncbi:hypothetical protein HZB02_00285 [Candidatus Woesearchaeota archaeon]|nr:hypothetical protein [Candidatus Woesearchaeota archaeon]